MSEAVKNLVNNDLADVMFNRHSVRQFDPNVKIGRDELQKMIAEAATAPSACNFTVMALCRRGYPRGKG